MPSTNKTDKLHLSQFEATDKPSFIQDYNADMQTLDTAVSGAQSDATEAKQSATVNSQSIREIEEKLNNTGLVYNFFSVNEPLPLNLMASNGRALVVINTGAGNGNNEIISPLSEKTIAINEGGVYIIWANVITSLFSNVFDGVNVYFCIKISRGSGGPAIRYDLYTKIPLIASTENPASSSSQNFIASPIIVRLNKNDKINVSIETNATGKSGNSNAYQTYAGTGVVKIG